MTDSILKQLFSNADATYREFSSALNPTVKKESFIGVRIPVLRKIARQMYNENTYKDFLSTLPHTYLEENMLHTLILSLICDYNELIEELDRFLPYIDNWAVCDSLRPKLFKTNRKRLIKKIDEWLLAKDTYTVRFAMEMLMVHFLDEDFDISYPMRLKDYKTDEYYLKLMLAWYFQKALSKQYESVIPIIEGRELDEWIHNKAIQKAKESLCMTKAQKEYLNSLKYKTEEKRCSRT